MVLAGVFAVILVRIIVGTRMWRLVRRVVVNCLVTFPCPLVRVEMVLELRTRICVI